MKFLMFLFLLLALTVSAAPTNPIKTNVFTANAIFLGDSWTCGLTAQGLTNPWPYWLTNLSTVRFDNMTNAAVGGDTATNQWATFNTIIKPRFANHKPTYVFGFYGAGMLSWLNRTNWGAECSAISNIFYASKTNGSINFAFTVPLVPYFTNTTNVTVQQQQETVRTNLNDYVRNLYLSAITVPGQAGLLVDYLVDLDPIYDITWTQGDRLHLSHEGSRFVAEQICAATSNSDYNDALGEPNLRWYFIPSGDHEWNGTNKYNGSMFVANLIVTNSAVVASNTASGLPGELRWNGTNLFICVATNLWGRTYLDTNTWTTP